MKRKNPDFEDLLPIELKLRLLEAEMGRLDSDLSWLQERREEISKEMQYYEKLLTKTRSRHVLRRVK
jgi:hypothetical protein